MEYTTVSPTKRLNRSIRAVWNVDSGRPEEPRISLGVKIIQAGQRTLAGILKHAYCTDVLARSTYSVHSTLFDRD